MDGVDAHGGGDGQQDGGDQHDDGDDLQEAAEDEHDDEGDEEEDQGVVHILHEEVGHQSGDLLHGQGIAESGRGGHHADDLAGLAHAVGDDGAQLLHVDLPIDHHGEEGGPHHRDNGRLGGGGDAQHDAAQDEQRGGQGQDRSLEGDQDLPQVIVLLVAVHQTVAILFALPHREDGQAQHGQDAGDNAADEQTADGHAGGGAIVDHDDAGGNDDAQQTGGGDDRAGEALAVAPGLHVGGHDAADGGGGGGSGAADGAEHGAGHHACDGQAAGEGAHQGVGKAQHPLADAALAHDITGQQEEGDGQQGEGVHAADGLLNKLHQGIAADHIVNTGGHTHGKQDGHTQRQQQEERAKQ